MKKILGITIFLSPCLFNIIGFGFSNDSPVDYDMYNYDFLLYSQFILIMFIYSCTVYLGLSLLFDNDKKYFKKIV